MTAEERRRKEKILLDRMIRIYCRGNHQGQTLCDSCRQIEEYAFSRIEHCPYMETKTFCSSCEVHCYQPEMRERIRKVMRYSGPRLMLYHPAAVCSHMADTILKKRRRNTR